MMNDLVSSKAPDILEVIADLSSDEVFTPPRVVTQVLDLLPAEVWSNASLRWLDPGCKTGVFLREITRRLMSGLADEIPDDQERLQHILKNQIFGIAITELTSMMSRRTVYCSKDAAGVHSVIQMPTSDGNIWFERVEHTYVNGKCRECSASKTQMERDNRDNYAYAFIHEAGRRAVWKDLGMKFDVIVGNPPYQMTGGGGGTNDTPLYNVFVEEAIKLNPRYVNMIVPSRWMAGGRGLEDFRASLLTDKRMTQLVDYTNAAKLFPGVEIKGGVCYFLWDRDNPGGCAMTIVRGDEVHGPEMRDLGEFDILVRDSRSLSILHKVIAKTEPSFSEFVSGDTPFGLPSNYRGYRKGTKKTGDLRLLMNEGGARVEHWVDPEMVRKNTNLIKKWKVFVPKAGSDGGQKLPDYVLGTPMIAGPGTVCSQTYLVIGPLNNEQEAERAYSYIQSRFARFLVSLRKISQDAMKSVYTWVPWQTWDCTWTDQKLYEKYGITREEQAYIESMVKELP